MKVELADIPIKSLVPEALANWKPKEGENMRDAFVTEMAKFDDEKTVLMQEAENKVHMCVYTDLILHVFGLIYCVHRVLWRIWCIRVYALI